MKRWLIAACTAMIAFFTAAPVLACTLFAAVGPARVQGGGTLIAKNRDWRPQPQELRLVTRGAYRYYGIFAGDDGKRKQLKGGVNERGLAVFSASASSIPRQERSRLPHAAHGAMTTMLANCATVDEALKHTECFLGPKFLLLADGNKAAWVEVGPQGRFSIREIPAGTLVHTNHYLDAAMEPYNVSIGTSSQTRCARMEELLAQHPGPMRLEDFAAFGQDHDAGPDNSIWRSGSHKNSTQTLAAMAVWLRAGEPPAIYVKIRENPADQGKEKVLWLQGADLFPAR